jgi:hypothetical protein
MLLNGEDKGVQSAASTDSTAVTRTLWGGQRNSVEYHMWVSQGVFRQPVGAYLSSRRRIGLSSFFALR